MLCACDICLSEFSSASVANKLQNVSKLLRELTDNFNSHLCHVTMSTFVLHFLPSNYCSSQTCEVSAPPRSDQKERAAHCRQPQPTAV